MRYSLETRIQVVILMAKSESPVTVIRDYDVKKRLKFQKDIQLQESIKNFLRLVQLKISIPRTTNSNNWRNDRQNWRGFEHGTNQQCKKYCSRNKHSEESSTSNDAWYYRIQAIYDALYSTVVWWRYGSACWNVWSFDTHPRRSSEWRQCFLFGWIMLLSFRGGEQTQLSHLVNK